MTTWIRAAVAGSAYKKLNSITHAMDHIVNTEFTIVLCGRVKPTSLLDDELAAGKSPVCLKCYSELLRRGIKLDDE